MIRGHFSLIGIISIVGTNDTFIEREIISKKGLCQIMVFDRGIYFADSTLIISTSIKKKLEASYRLYCVSSGSFLLFLGMLFCFCFHIFL